MFTRRRLLATLSCAVLTPARAQAAPVRVFAASSLQGALAEAGRLWHRETGHQMRLSFAASAALVRQIEQGAPADLFASADLGWMEEAERRGLIVSGSRRVLFGNRLVLIAGRGDAAALRIAPGFDLAGALGEGRLAMGDPASVPAGRYAREALTALGVWDKVAGRVAAGVNVRAALALVARGEARFGIVYATDAAAEPGLRVLDTFPQATHAAIVYPFARVKGASPEAESFLAWLAGPAGRGVFAAQGFSVLP